MLPVFSLLISISGQDPLDQKISLDLPPAQARKIIPELGNKIGLPLDAGESVSNDILLLCFRDLTGREVMDALAERVMGEWKQMDGKQFLSRSPAKVQARKRKAIDERYRQYLAAVEKRIGLVKEPMTKESVAITADRMLDLDAKLMANQSRFDSKLYEERERLQESGPGRRLAARLLDRIDWKVVANLGRDGRVVFATNPTSKQLPFTKSVEDVWNVCEKEHELWTKGIEDAKLKRGGNDEESPYFGYNAWDRKFEVKPNNIMVIVQDMSWGEYPTIELRIYDDAGNMIVSDGTNLDTENGRFGSRADDEPEPEASKIVLTIADEYKSLYDEFVAVMEKAMNSSDYRFKFSDNVRNLVLHPEDKDPLEVFSLGVLNEYARKRNFNIVSRVPDQIFAMPLMTLQQSKEVTVSRLETAIAPFWNFDKVNNIGWFEPSKSKEADNVNANRAGMGKFIRSVAEKGGRVTLKDSYEQALSELNVRTDQPIAMMLMFLILGSDAEQLALGMDRSSNYELLLWGSLQGSQMQSLTAGKSIPYGSLNPTQRGFANMIVYGTNPKINVASDADAEKMIQQQIEDNGMVFPSYSSDIRAEPTYSLPIGVPTNAQISMKVNTSTVLFPAQKDGMRSFSMGTSVSQIAFMIFAKSRPDLFRDEYYQGSDMDKFRTASRTTYIVRIQLAKDLSTTFALNDTEPMSKESMTLDQLPEDIRTAIKKRLNDLAEQYKNMKPGDFTPGTPPPVKP